MPLVVMPLVARYLPESIDFLVAKGRIDEARSVARRLGIHFATNLGDARSVHRDRSAAPVRALFGASSIRATLAFWVAMFMGLLLLYGLSTWLPQLMRKAGFPLGSSLGLLAVLNLTAAFGSLAGGAIADRFGSKPVVGALYVLAALSLCALPFTHELVGIYVLVGIAGVGTIGNTMLLGAYITRYYPSTSRATGIGWALGVGRFGAIAGPLIGGLMVQLDAPLTWNFYVFAIAGVAAACVLALVPTKVNEPR
jgi:AAHS family benzoate transporter-like MFS transporter